MNLTPYLEDIESRIDPDYEETLLTEWKNFADGKAKSGPFTPPTRRTEKSKIEWKHVNINDAIEDIELMKLAQLEQIHYQMENSRGGLLWLRPNYGAGNIPLLCGAARFIMPRKTDTAPNVKSLGGVDEIRRFLDAPTPPIHCDKSRHLFEFGEWFAGVCEKYPKIGKYVRIDHPDGQGPIDLAELLFGSEMFYAMYDEPELVHALLKRTTEMYIAFMTAWFDAFPNPDGYFSYFGSMGRGRFVIRADSAMNLSPDMYGEFVLPYDNKVFSALGAGGFHYCGKGDHFISQMASTVNLTTIDMTQPELNDM